MLTCSALKFIAFEIARIASLKPAFARISSISLRLEIAAMLSLGSEKSGKDTSDRERSCSLGSDGDGGMPAALRPSLVIYVSQVIPMKDSLIRPVKHVRLLFQASLMLRPDRLPPRGALLYSQPFICKFSTH